MRLVYNLMPFKKEGNWDEAGIASGHTILLSSLIPRPATIECDFFFHQ